MSVAIFLSVKRSDCEAVYSWLAERLSRPRCIFGFHVYSVLSVEERSFSPGEPRPTLATLLETDLAVSQAVQKLQELKVGEIVKLREYRKLKIRS